MELRAVEVAFAQKKDSLEPVPWVIHREQQEILCSVRGRSVILALVRPVRPASPCLAAEPGPEHRREGLPHLLCSADRSPSKVDDTVERA